jgi:hypothetical protein
MFDAKDTVSQRIVAPTNRTKSEPQKTVISSIAVLRAELNVSAIYQYF